MSGEHASSNPFRRKPLVARSIKAHGEGDLDRPSSSLQVEAPQPATKKRVRIKTPPPRSDKLYQSSPFSTSLKHSSVDKYSDSTASDSSESIDESPFGSVNQVKDGEDDGPDDEELLRNARNYLSTAALLAQSSQGHPSNPFSGTLAKVDGPSKGASSKTEILSPSGPKHPTSFEKQDPSAARLSLDVDSFKRLLLTGNASQPTSTQILASASAQANMQPGIPGDNSSSTDTSSISRQSIFEPQPEAFQDTPRSSHDASPSENAKPRPWSELLPAAEKKKPPLPVSRHGKLFGDLGPQTAALEGSSLLSSSAGAPPNLLADPISSPTASSPTDRNKFLSSSPQSDSPTHETAAEGVSWESASQSASSGSSFPLSTPRKRVPPPPPLARRYSQLRSSNKYSTSEQSARPVSNEEPSTPALSALSESQVSPPTKHPPPPPRPSRHHQISQSSDTPHLPEEPCAISSSTTDMDPHQSYTTPSTALPSAPPPPPPSRTPSISSIKRPLRASPNSAAAGGMAPPPPPPPRHRGSSQSSLEHGRSPFHPPGSNRASGEFRQSSSEGQRRASGASSLGRAPSSGVESAEIVEVNKGAVANDIMGELETLQREVDELRGKYAAKRGTG